MELIFYFKMKRNIDIWIKLILRHFQKNEIQGIIFFSGISIAFVLGSVVISIFAGTAIYEIIIKLYSHLIK